MVTPTNKTNCCYDCIANCCDRIASLMKKKGHKKQDTRIEISVKRINEEKAPQVDPPKPIKQKTLTDLTRKERIVPDGNDYWVYEDN